MNELIRYYKKYSDKEMKAKYFRKYTILQNGVAMLLVCVIFGYMGVFIFKGLNLHFVVLILGLLLLFVCVCLSKLIKYKNSIEWKVIEDIVDFNYISESFENNMFHYRKNKVIEYLTDKKLYTQDYLLYFIGQADYITSSKISKIQSEKFNVFLIFFGALIGLVLPMIKLDIKGFLEVNLITQIFVILMLIPVAILYFFIFKYINSEVNSFIDNKVIKRIHKDIGETLEIKDILEQLYLEFNN